MRTILTKSATALVLIGLLLPGALIMHEIPAASAAPAYGRVTVSGTNILVDGAVPQEKFFGVDDTTALQFAIMTYINGEQGVRGWSSVFNGPDTPNHPRRPVVPNDTPENFWHQYFALLQYYDCNLVRIGCGDTWGTGLQYNAWKYHHDAYIDLLRIMCEQAEAHGVWVTLVLAGSQEYPTFQFGGSGSVFDPTSSAFSNYVTYCRDVMAELENEDAICWYDLFNEPDHNYVAQAYWQGDKYKFHNWASAAASATAGASSHPRTMGVAALGTLFNWNKADFDLAVGKIGVEILHVHYYGSNYDANNFALPESWARQNGKPLFWGELAWNGVYPLTRYTFAEQAIWNAGGQAIASMVLTGTPGYPYYGGSLVDDHDPPVDTTPPALSVTSPDDGSRTGQSSVSVAWTGSDASGIRGYQYRLDGGAWSSLASATSATFDQLSEGQHVVEVVARDNAGNSAQVSVGFTVDLTGPEISITAPEPEARLPATAEVTWTATDPSGVIGYRYRLNGDTWSSVTTLTSRIFEQLADGRHTVEVEAVDGVGNSAAAVATFIVDTSLPRVAILTPLGGTHINDTSVSISWSSESVDSLVRTEVRVDGGTWTVQGEGVTTIEISSLYDGEHIIEVRNTYASGSSIDSVRFHVDTVAPTVESFSPEGEVQSAAVIKVAFSEPMGSAAVNIPGVEGTISWDGNTLVFTPSSTLERCRSHSVKVSASDLAGNAITAEWSFRLAEPAPVKGLVKDAAGKPVAGATVALSTGDTAITDADGTFTFRVEPGTYDATVSKDGYQVAMVTVHLGLEQIAEVGLTEGSGPADYFLPVAGVVLFGAALLGVSLLLSRKRR